MEVARAPKKKTNKGNKYLSWHPGMNVFHDNQTALMDGPKFFHMKRITGVNAIGMKEKHHLTYLNN